MTTIFAYLPFAVMIVLFLLDIFKVIKLNHTTFGILVILIIPFAVFGFFDFDFMNPFNYFWEMIGGIFKTFYGDLFFNENSKLKIKSILILVAYIIMLIYAMIRMAMSDKKITKPLYDCHRFNILAVLSYVYSLPFFWVVAIFVIRLFDPVVWGSPVAFFLWIFGAMLYFQGVILVFIAFVLNVISQYFIFFNVLKISRVNERIKKLKFLYLLMAIVPLLSQFMMIKLIVETLRSARELKQSEYT